MKIIYISLAVILLGVGIYFGYKLYKGKQTQVSVAPPTVIPNGPHLVLVPNTVIATPTANVIAK